MARRARRGRRRSTKPTEPAGAQPDRSVVTAADATIVAWMICGMTALATQLGVLLAHAMQRFGEPSPVVANLATILALAALMSAALTIALTVGVWRFAQRRPPRWLLATMLLVGAAPWLVLLVAWLLPM